MTTHDFQQVCVSLPTVLYILVVLSLCIVAHFLYESGCMYMVMCMQVAHMYVQVCVHIWNPEGNLKYGSSGVIQLFFFICTVSPWPRFDEIEIQQKAWP